MSSLNKILCIPEIGTRVRLQEDWTFVLYDEHRNKSMMELYGLSRGHWQSYGKPIDFITLPAGIEMAVERIYIRNGLADFSSITFRVQKADDERFYKTVGKAQKRTIKKARFWAKLADVNEAKMVVIDDKAADETQEATTEEDTYNDGQ